MSEPRIGRAERPEAGRCAVDGRSGLLDAVAARGEPDAEAVSGRRPVPVSPRPGRRILSAGLLSLQFIYDCEVIEEPVGLGKRTTVKTPYGDLSEFQEWYPDSFCIGWSERFVKSWRDLKAMRYFYEHTHFEPDYAPVQRRYDLVGDNGLVLMLPAAQPLPAHGGP